MQMPGMDALVGPGYRGWYLCYLIAVLLPTSAYNGRQRYHDMIRPVQLTRPTSWTIQFEPRTSPYCSQQVPRTCLAISQLPLDSEKSMTYQFISTFHDKSIYFVRLKFEALLWSEFIH